MVKVAGTFGRSGAHDYILLRASALVLLAFILYLVGFVAFNDINYLSWTNFFSLTFTKVLTLFALVAMLVHAWIGLWQVLTDYVKCTKLRGALQFLLTSVAFIYVISGFVILWGV
ncbi:succinate dehydrogenase, hydrophobic membrane anchor protein [Psychromonas sp. psych-6C06]|uniref:succinate dehydrogenase, hydrophobic membrane anchor protein n=1 Tax=Psychromonas sp. psych-6C06 TaxID=2058089 RepID=UPI000C34961F|nr:succinate dehydrogenase, hydrophobic membrane anchor protein [Psychromonas sp. psych-6C06]PKF60428.1 succinate dehydrogenase, hydrophobic membrane anchor protein [Psychromonas sp. psych-6C06]